ncbi:hypothetical protein DAEQUDRAFT_662081 [Daedalea quercina L-15889]|uniref:4a-hydroxytetrahydrobiopterin dehydratase n=1 Tax=Daedalea quercina L-15889 TaxID=1314783 RepID=A0A165TK84_9APHY|nr:hypothetical protein DAEQUDRAFT_662081 [Daedalea quercina L-15889]
MQKKEESEEEKEKRLQQEEAEVKAQGLKPLPSLPEAPKYPCPYLTEQEIAMYLQPLYEQGWFIGSSEFMKDKRLGREVEYAPQLVKIFRFSPTHPEHREALLAFMESVSQMQTAENHHCNVLVDGESVQIRTHTHSARPLPNTNEENPRERPGITLRDVRLAILVEQLFHDHLRNDAALWRSQKTVVKSFVRPPTPFGIECLRRLGYRTRSMKCPVCGGRHKGVDCIHKDSIAPRTPCSRCGQMHWKFMCNAVD